MAPLVQRQGQFADWSPANTAAHNENIEAYSNCEEVELVLNGKSLGSKPLNADASPRTWSVPFEPGKLKAIGKNKGKVVATHELRTAGKPEKIVLTPDRSRLGPGWDEVSRVAVSVVDKDGIAVPNGSDLISFKISGPGVIAAVDNADGASHELFQASERHLYQGECVAVLRATASSGKITLTASAPGLAAGSVSLSATSK
jgi:beta-galactosidase